MPVQVAEHGGAGPEHALDRRGVVVAEGPVGLAVHHMRQVDPEGRGVHQPEGAAPDAGPRGGGGLDGVIVRLQPERDLAYVWGRAVVEWTLEPDGAGCRYTFVHHGQVPAPAGTGWTDEGLAAGYHTGLDALARLLDGDAAPPAPRDPWAQLAARYRPPIKAVLRPAPGREDPAASGPPRPVDRVWGGRPPDYGRRPSARGSW